MSLLSRIADLIARDRGARRPGEEDAPVDPLNTGPLPDDEFVGRVGSDETETDVSGAEARGGTADGRTGAARDE